MASIKKQLTFEFQEYLYLSNIIIVNKNVSNKLKLDLYLIKLLFINLSNIYIYIYIGNNIYKIVEYIVICKLN